MDGLLEDYGDCPSVEERYNDMDYEEQQAVWRQLAEEDQE